MVLVNSTTLVTFPFFIWDAESNRPPLNLLIIICMISMVPVLKGKAVVLVFMLPTLANLVIYAAINSNVIYMLYAIIFSLAGVLITVSVHRQYVLLIKELHYHMIHDSLTKLLSRHAGEERAEQLLSVCKRNRQCFVAIMMDIDFFKSYNDSKGHLYGDEILQKVSGAIQSSFNRGSDIVFRYGGEEFCACFSANAKDIELMTDRLMERVRELDITAECCDVSERLTMSLGVSSCKNGDKALADILRQADEQLYISKKLGRNRISFTEC